VIALSFLTVSTLRYPNPSASPWFLGLLTLALGAVWWGAPVAVPVVWALLVGGAAFVVFAPLINLERR